MGGGSYPSAEVQSVYSTAPADWASSKLSEYHLKNKNVKENDNSFLHILSFFNYKIILKQ